jgi:diguanylate cyclase (GGDEF)-like protein
MISHIKRQLLVLRGERIRDIVLVALLGVAATVFVFLKAHEASEKEMRGRFERWANLRGEILSQKLEQVSRDFVVLAQVCGSSVSVDREEFSRLASSVVHEDGVEFTAWAELNPRAGEFGQLADTSRWFELGARGTGNIELGEICLNNDSLLREKLAESLRLGRPLAVPELQAASNRSNEFQNSIWVVAPVLYATQGDYSADTLLPEVRGFTLLSLNVAAVATEAVRLTPAFVLPTTIVNRSQPTPSKPLFQLAKPETGSSTDFLSRWLPSTPQPFERSIHFAEQELLLTVTCDSRGLHLSYLALHWLILPGGLMLTVLLVTHLVGLKIQRRQAEELVRQRTEEVRLDEARLESLSRISHYQGRDVREILDFALRECMALTASTIGAVFTYDEVRKEFTLVGCVPKDAERTESQDQRVVFSLENSGCWQEVILRKKAIVLNDPLFLESAPCGQSKSHRQRRRFLAVPVLDGPSIGAVVGVFDKQSDYDRSDTRQLTLLMDFAWGIASRKLVEDELKQSKERLRTQFMNIPIPTFIWQQDDDDLQLTDYNEAALSFTKHRIARMVGIKATKMYADMPEVVADMKNCLFQKKTVLRETPYTLRTTGEQKYLTLRYAYIPPDLVMIHMEDITSQKVAEEELRYLSHHDSLTGLFNRRFAETEIIRLASGRRFPIGIIVVDIDKLKETNDRDGHAAGDKQIQDTARLLRQTFRPEDMVARSGGDEFLVVLPQISSAILDQSVNRLRVNLEELNSSRKGPQLQLSVGSSVSYCPDTLEDAIKHADRLMYREKEEHRSYRRIASTAWLP